MSLPPFALMEEEGAVRPSCPLLRKGTLRTPEPVVFTKRLLEERALDLQALVAVWVALGTGTE